MSPLLEARAVSRVFGRGSRARAAVDQVSFVLHEGQTLGVVGGSGSGKSTLGEVVGGLQRPSSGTVLFDGHDVASLDRAGKRAYRRAVQFIFQDPQASMDPAFTIERVVAEPLEVLEPELTGAARADRVHAMLERVGLSRDISRARPSELSGGQCQRAAVARALVAQPRVVVCDECTSALDVSVQAQVLNLLCDLQDEFAVSYLFISHNMGVVAAMSDELLVMDAGRACEQGPVGQILAHPVDPYTKTLLAAAERGGSSWR